ncbi:hypothetical protein JCM13664_11960 [Methylothermus subterraneus]|nr:hypothetical protein HGMM_F42A12C24 [uncultured Gammaproteobacteria bacterium]
MYTPHDDTLGSNLKASIWLAIPLALAFLWLTLGFSPKESTPYFLGEKVLAKCQDAYLLGTIEKVRTLGYAVHFGPETQPILCANYLWQAEFLESYQPVAQFQHGQTTWQIGDQVELAFLVEGKKRTLKAKISDLTSSGKVSLKYPEGEPLAVAYFQSHIGKNYVPLGAYWMRKL